VNSHKEKIVKNSIKNIVLSSVLVVSVAAASVVSAETATCGRLLYNSGKITTKDLLQAGNHVSTAILPGSVNCSFLPQQKGHDHAVTATFYGNFVKHQWSGDSNSCITSLTNSIFGASCIIKGDVVPSA